jgi:C4-dicarboxylate transporter, DctM subunit
VFDLGTFDQFTFDEAPPASRGLHHLVNPVHLGVLMIVNTEVGLCHPPVGLNLYIASGIAKMGISEITVCAMLIFLGLITYIPEISLWLPRLLGMI